MLALIALRQMEAKFEAVHAELAPLYKGRLKPKPSDYQARGPIFLDKARFSASPDRLRPLSGENGRAPWSDARGRAPFRVSTMRTHNGGAC